MRSVLTLACVFGLSAIIADAEPKAARPPRFNDTHTLIFHAVLEGCYRDGLSAEDLDLIIPPTEDGNDRQMAVNFVYACPICHPAFEAFRLYASRKPFVGQKGTQYDTFGPGLKPTDQRLLADEPTVRRAMIQALIKKWIDERIRAMRLTDEETKQVRAELAELRKRGELQLKAFQAKKHGDYFHDIYKDWKGCPICSGASPMG